MNCEDTIVSNPWFDMKALRTIPIRIPIEIQCTEDPRVVDGSEYTGIYLYWR